MSRSKELKIASLLPSSTEICVVLGLTDQLVGRSHECDFPPEIRSLPVLTRATVDSTASSREIDRQVRSQLSEGLSLYQVEEERLRDLAPDVVLTQDVCDLCAVSFSTVKESVERWLGPETQLVSLSPTSVDDVLQDIQRVADAVGVSARGRQEVDRIRSGLDELERLTVDLLKPGLPKPSSVLLEWLDPPMTGGHWTPELLRRAGARSVLGHDFRPTQADTWQRIRAEDPETVLLAPCGFGMDQTRRELADLLENPEFRSLTAYQEDRVFVIDGNHYFNRPGPRLLESARIAARIHHPELAGRLEIPEGSWAPLRSLLGA